MLNLTTSGNILAKGVADGKITQRQADAAGRTLWNMVDEGHISTIAEAKRFARCAVSFPETGIPYSPKFS